MTAILFFIGIVTLILFSIAFSFWLDKKRREALRVLAEEMGLLFHPDGFDGALQGVANLKLFNTGRSKKLSKAIVAQSDGTTLCIFDYQYTVGHGKHSQTHVQTVAAIKSYNLEIPDFAVKVEGFFNKLGSMMGMQDIDFESHPEFSRMFLLTGSDENAIRKLFRPELLDYFETRQGIAVEANSGGFVCYHPGRKVNPAEIKQFMTTAYEIYGQLLDSIESSSNPKT